jgi:hypothetical protein
MNMMNNQFGVGVVEDRHDPIQLGRVRVRVFGIHSHDRINDIQIEDLPWSIVMQPTNASTSAGNISQLVEGTWVLVLFLDENFQDYIVLGSLPGASPDADINFSQGFTDPYGRFPRWRSETNSPRKNLSELSLVAKEDEWIEHPTYEARKTERRENIPLAKTYEMSTTLPQVRNENTQYWNEKDLRGADNIDPDSYISQYPYNSVREYEGGILEEYDSSPETESGESRIRITEMHPSGSYREIVGDGTTTFKIIGDGYHLTLKDQYMYIEGDLNITVGGNVRHLVNGNYILEVRGDYIQRIGGNRGVKISGNDGLEVLTDQSTNISENYHLRCGNDRTITVDNNQTVTIQGEENHNVFEDSNKLVSGNLVFFTGSNMSFSSGSNLSLSCAGTYKAESIGTMKLNSLSTMELTSLAMTSAKSNGIFTVRGSIIKLN